MDCKEIQDNLSAYMDRELAPAEEEGVRLHLGVCDQCTAHYAKLLKGWQALDAWEDVTPPDRIRGRILATARPQRKSTSLRAILSVAAALVLVFGASVYYVGPKGGLMQNLVGQPPAQTSAVGDSSEDEIIANLLILQDNDFFEELDELVMIDDLPFAEEPSKKTKEPERSSLEIVFT